MLNSDTFLKYLLEIIDNQHYKNTVPEFSEKQKLKSLRMINI